MTYDELGEAISNMTPDERANNVTVFVPGIDEFYPIGDISHATDTGVLDEGHPILNIAGEED
jgi:hypothetical protein